MPGFVLVLCLALLCCGVAAGHADPAAPSCRQTAGARRAARYVHECLLVAGTPDAPCNAGNSCVLIRSAVRAGCAAIHQSLARQPALAQKDSGRADALVEPSFCKRYDPAPH